MKSGLDSREREWECARLDWLSVRSMNTSRTSTHVPCVSDRPILQQQGEHAIACLQHLDLELCSKQPQGYDALLTVVGADMVYNEHALLVVGSATVLQSLPR